MTMMALKYNGTPQFLFQGETGAEPTSPGSSTPDAPGSSQAPASGTTDTSVDSTGGGEAFESIFALDGAEPVPGQTTQAPAKAEVPPEVPQATAPPAQQAVQPPQPQPAQPQPPAQAPAPQPQAQPQQQPAGGVPEGLDRFNPAQLAQALTANRDQVVDTLASHVFSLSPQETEALETNVVEAIPKLMAKVFLHAQVSTLTQMANILPVMMQRHQTLTRGAETSEGAFYKAWPTLNKATHGELVNSYTTMFRRMYPNATLQDVINHVGHMVAGAVGAQAPRGTAAPGPGQAPMTQGNGRSPPPSPFVPAGGRGPASPSTGQELSPWEAVFGHQG